MSTKPNVSAQTSSFFSDFKCHIFFSEDDGGSYVRQLGDKLRQAGIDLSINSSDLILDVGHYQYNAVIYVMTPQSMVSDRVQSLTLQAIKLFRTTRLLAINLCESILSDSISNSMIDIISNTTVSIINLFTDFDGTDARSSQPSAHAVDVLSDFAKGDLSVQVKVAKSKRTRALNEVKLILVGRGEVGKTSLVRRLAGLTFRGDESKTQGINITELTLRHRRNTVKIHLWDFGGQEIMHATHQFFLTERNLYILVLNGREGAEDVDAEYWIKQIQSFGADSPIIIVQNKISQHPFDLNYRGLKNRYSQISGFIKTDCKGWIGINQLQKTIKETLVKMSEVRVKFPESWFAVKQRLEAVNEDFIGYEYYRQLCREEQINDESDMDSLSWVLHCL